MSIILGDLSLPFPPDDIEWRVMNAGRHGDRIYCGVAAFITARAVQERLDSVCGVDGWQILEPQVTEACGRILFGVGISVRNSDGEWITKWDMAAPSVPKTQSEEERLDPAKNGFSRALKRAACQFGIGRQLHYIKTVFAETTEVAPSKQDRWWHKAKLPKTAGGGTYYWKTPTLPASFLPKEPEHKISQGDLNELKKEWKGKFAPDNQNPAELREGFTRFVHSLCGEFPTSDVSCWLRESWEKCMTRIESTTEADGPDSDVPFEK